MKKTIRLFLLCLVVLLVALTPATAQVATLTWDQSTQSEVTGYKVYYRTDAPSFPFDGNTLAEGASPIVVQGADKTTLTVDLPEDGHIYYFTATSVSDSGQESGYSDIIASEWIPYLLSPTQDAALNTAVTFTWGQAPVGYNVTYELVYGTDPNLAPATNLVPPQNGSEHPPANLWLALPLALLLALLPAVRSGRLRRGWTPVRVGLCVAVMALQASCGGAGDGASAQDPVTNAPVLPLSTTVVNGIAGTSYQVADLQPGTRYYWQIVAVDSQGYTYESVIKSFTTLNN